MRTEIFLSTLAAASSVFGALNEPCIGSGVRAGMSLPPTTSLHPFLFNNKGILTPTPLVFRRLRHNRNLLLQRRRLHHGRLPRRRGRRPLLHQGGLQHLGQLPLAVRLRRHLVVRLLPGPLPDEVLLVHRDRLRRLLHPDLPGRGRLPGRRRQRRQGPRGRLPRPRPPALLHPRLHLQQQRLRPLLRQGD